MNSLFHINGGDSKPLSSSSSSSNQEAPIQRVRSTPTYPLSQPQQQHEKKSWFSKFKRQNSHQNDLPTTDTSPSSTSHLNQQAQQTSSSHHATTTDFSKTSDGIDNARQNLPRRQSLGSVLTPSKSLLPGTSFSKDSTFPKQTKNDKNNYNNANNTKPELSQQQPHTEPQASGFLFNTLRKLKSPAASPNTSLLNQAVQEVQTSQSARNVKNPLEASTIQASQGAREAQTPNTAKTGTATAAASKEETSGIQIARQAVETRPIQSRKQSVVSTNSNSKNNNANINSTQNETNNTNNNRNKGSCLKNKSGVKTATQPTQNGDNNNKDQFSENEFNPSSLLRVTFSVDTFNHDPPQQIPAREPKDGNVLVNETTGQILRPCCYYLDCTTPGAYAHAANIARSTAHNTALLVANSVRADFKKPGRIPSLNVFAGRGGGANKAEKQWLDSCEDEQMVDSTNSFAQANGKNIDGSVNKKSEFPSAAEGGASSKDNDDDCSKQDDSDSDLNSNQEKPLDLVDLYTRCCHLREILPIQATLRQLQNKHAPLPAIQLMNPCPTMIEVLSFADFLSVAPITALILDNADFTEEMFKIILLSLTNADHLFKLSLQNVNLTPANWQLLCCFMAHNKYISKLDISLKYPKPGKKKIRYKMSKSYSREHLDWGLLSRAIIKRGGLEELNINSCYLPREAFKKLVNEGVSVATRRLGAASSDLQDEEFQTLVQWVSAPGSVCEGLDVSGNVALANNFEAIKTFFTHKNLLYLSLSSCNISDPVKFSNILVDAAPTASFRYLDLSFNPLLFPHISQSFFAALAKMPYLTSLHVDYNNLDSQDILLLADAIPKCPRLSHISLLGNQRFNDAAAEALAVAVKLSPAVSLVNVDPGVLSKNIARRLAHYCIQKMEKLINVSSSAMATANQQELQNLPDQQDLQQQQRLQQKEQEEGKDGYNFDGEDEIFDDGKELVKAVSYVVDRNQQSNIVAAGGGGVSSSKSLPGSSSITSSTSTSDLGVAAGENKQPAGQAADGCALLCNALHLSADGLALRAKRIREKVQIKIQELIKQYKLREMPDSARDKFARFWYLNMTLDHVIQRYEIATGKVKASDVTQTHCSTMPSLAQYRAQHASKSQSENGNGNNNNDNKKGDMSAGADESGIKAGNNGEKKESLDHTLDTNDISDLSNYNSISVASLIGEYVSDDDNDDDGENSTGTVDSSPLVSPQYTRDSNSIGSEKPNSGRSSTDSSRSGGSNDLEQDKPMLYRECNVPDLVISQADAANNNANLNDHGHSHGHAHDSSIRAQELLSTDKDQHYVNNSNSDVRSVPSHDSYGVCVLPKRHSSTSLHARQQEREEGEVMKMGVLIKEKALRMDNGIISMAGKLDDDDNETAAGNEGQEGGPAQAQDVQNQGVLNQGGDNDGSSKASTSNSSNTGNGGDTHLTEAEQEAEPFLDLFGKPASKFLTVSFSKTGEELRQLILSEPSYSGNDSENEAGSDAGDKSGERAGSGTKGRLSKFEEHMEKIKAMTPEAFEEYFLELDARAALEKK